MRKKLIRMTMTPLLRAAALPIALLSIAALSIGSMACVVDGTSPEPTPESKSLEVQRTANGAANLVSAPHEGTQTTFASPLRPNAENTQHGKAERPTPVNDPNELNLDTVGPSPDVPPPRPWQPGPSDNAVSNAVNGGGGESAAPKIGGADSSGTPPPH